MVFNHEERSATFQQLAERTEQLRDVVEMQTRRRFVENVENSLIVGAAQMCRELQPLRFSTRKRCRRLSEPQVAESNFIQHSELENNFWYIDEERQRFTNRQL